MDSEKKDTTKSQAPEQKTIISKKCEKHNNTYEASRTEYKIGDRIRYHETQCPLCHEEEDRERREMRSRECEGQRISDYKSSTKAVGIPKRYKGLSLSDMVPVNEKQGVIIDRCKKYIEKFNDLRDQGTSLIFTGRPGTGKTHIALSMVDGIIKTFCDNAFNYNIKRDDIDYLTSFKPPCLYVNTYDLFAKIKSTYSKDNFDTEASILEKYSTVEVLILDEVGVQSGTDYESMMMFRIINSRYENMRPTFIISNLSEKDLSEYIGERTIDRFYENNGAVFIFDWESKRRE